MVRQFVFASVIWFLKKLGQNLYTEFWDTIVESLLYAENYWQKKGSGEIKKEYVISKVTTFLNKKVGESKIGRLKRRLILRFLHLVIDDIIKYLNDDLGRIWLDKLMEAEKRIRRRITFLF